MFNPNVKLIRPKNNTQLNIQHLNPRVLQGKLEEYDRIMKQSKEYLAAQFGLGPYVGFGLSDIHGSLTMVIG